MLYKKNYKSNLQVTLPEQYLNGQSLGDLREMKFGAKTLDDNGCGPVAVYNAMVYLKRPMKMADIIKELENYAAPIGARFGTSGLLLSLFFWKHHVRFRYVWRIKRLDRAKAGILLYWTKRPFFSGGHFVFFEKTEDGRIAVYNRYSNSSQIHYFDSFREYVKQKCVCMGFAFK